MEILPTYPKIGHHLWMTPYGYSEEPHKKNVLGYSPDITSSHHVVGSTVGSSGAGSSGTGTNSANGNTHGHMTPTTVCYEYSYPDSNSNHSKSGRGGGGGGGSSEGFLRPLSEHHYEQPMVVLPPSQNSPSDSLDKPATGSR